MPTSAWPRLPVAVIASGGDLSVMLGSIRSAMASREVHNEAFLSTIPDWTAQDVRQRTGIERRYWLGDKEDALSLAVRAARETLESEGLQISDVDALVCSTGTPGCMTPSMACRILRELSPEQGDVMVQAHDVNAACSGYLYALQTAWDLIHSRPEARVLVVTTETLSPLLDLSDPGTAFLFGDAATATIVSRYPGKNGAAARLHRPVLSAKGEPDHVLYVPAIRSGERVQMEGQQVFRVAIRRMIQMLEFACAESGIAVEDLSMIVPHQANTRIIDAIRQKIRAPEERMFNNIRLYGNTSSNTIPFALQGVLPARKPGDKIGLCAFGGGFTFGAAILERL
jgi:2-oxoisovalerate dehydrogenase E1 component